MYYSANHADFFIVDIFNIAIGKKLITIAGMSEPEKKDNFEYVEMSPMTHYYNDVYVVREDRSSAVLAIVDLVQSFPVRYDTTLDKLLKSDYMPFEWEMENDIVIAKEKLAMLPLHVLAPDLADSNCDLDNLKTCYNDSLRGIRMIAQDIHSKECLGHTATTHRMCDFSTICPWRFMEQFLLTEAKCPDFSQDIYKTAPKREFTIVKNNIDLAVRHDLVSFNKGDDIFDAYAARFDRFMYSRSLNPPDRIA